MAFWDTVGKYMPLAIAGGAGVAAGKGLYDKGLFSPSKISSLDPEQQKIYQQLATALQGGESSFSDLFGFDPEKMRELYTQQYAEPAYQQFQEEVVPGITGQFRGQNLQNSSYLGGALGKAGTDVQKNLNANLSNMLYQGEQSALNRKQQGLNQILNMQTFAYQQSPLMQLLKSLAGGAGKAVGSFLGG